MKKGWLSLALLLTACSSQLPLLDTLPSSSSSSFGLGAGNFSLAASSAPNELAVSLPYSSASSIWNDGLSEAQLDILQGGTERPFTSPLLDEHRPGTYYSVDCDLPLFRSEQKFDSGTGWPSFWAPIESGAIVEQVDTSLGIKRTEILSKCGGHLGHVFSDGPEPTGLRYCVNGLALRFVPDPE
ncbi:MAG TPA: peptide-methionine (R)-S-oxide reductase MsrB [Candidatus Peribacteraceae bacterium]|nr:peptide-methionine (R)-S-oxide reductase MsrB [Candidatus Peribacteraceae bacterium]